MANPLDLLSFAKRAWETTQQPLKERGIPGQEFNPEGGLSAYFSPYAIANVLAPVGTYEDGRMGPALPKALTDLPQFSDFVTSIPGGAYNMVSGIFERGRAAAESPIPPINDDAAWADKSAAMFDMTSLAPLGGMLGAVEGAVGSAGGKLAAGASKDLPMDLASRMARAREMGFDTDRVLYHGTGKTFDEFNPGTRGNGTPRSIYLTDNPEIADIYANSQNYGLKGGGDPMIYPVFAKAEKPLIVSDRGPDGSFGWVSDNLAAALGVDHPTAGKYATLYDEARRQGYDQVQIREMMDLGGQQTQYIPLRPEYIRSVNAAFDPAKSDSANLLAANAKEGALPGLVANALDQPQGIRAYHGSPHDFDRFDLSKIGTGEGAQAYGHGLYFAESEDVARSYRDTLGARNFDSASFADHHDLPNVVRDFLANKGYPNDDQAVSTAVNQIKNSGWTPRDLDYERLGVKPPGRMYEVNIRANPEDFLDWDKPLSQQQRLIDMFGVDEQGRLQLPNGERVPPDKLRGESFYKAVAEANAGGRGPASDVLREAGIPGIKYLDGMSRGAGEGSSNYVLFSDDIIDILRKYSNAPTAAAIPFGTQAGQDDQLPSLWDFLR